MPRKLKQDPANRKRRRKRDAKKVAHLLPPLGQRIKLTAAGLTKMCTHCGVVKLLSRDYHRGNGGAGYTTICKDCARKYKDNRGMYQQRLARLGSTGLAAIERANYQSSPKKLNRIRERRRARYRADHKSLLAPRCIWCRRWRIGLAYALRLRQWAWMLATESNDQSTFRLFCQRHNRYVYYQRAYAAHTAAHWGDTMITGVRGGRRHTIKAF